MIDVMSRLDTIVLHLWTTLDSGLQILLSDLTFYSPEWQIQFHLTGAFLIFQYGRECKNVVICGFKADNHCWVVVLSLY